MQFEATSREFVGGVATDNDKHDLNFASAKKCSYGPYLLSPPLNHCLHALDNIQSFQMPRAKFQSNPKLNTRRENWISS
ncbi:hypothetical protein M413DRAFT_115591 [Hebeloma cylindrosporum]|uniref:Uncharacterized protein n=1 Tax=Hebeloma cylindrosporum TaxID=76867 RepID=A0A0C2Z9B9_HEBCY|nr:hypothetical protein M413DRAFT_115591 [Hebeloma cylindrosporum h7]